MNYLVSIFKNYQFKRHLKEVSHLIIKSDNSIFLNSFRLISNLSNNKKLLSVGDNTMLDCQIVFESNKGNVHIGDNTFIGDSKIISRSKVNIGDFVFIAWGCYIYDHDSHSLDFNERQNDIQQQLKDYQNGTNFIQNKNWEVVNSKPIKICNNSWIGMNCIILKGVTIGEGAVVAAGSVVTKDVNPWTVAGGNPAKQIKEIPSHLRKKQ